MTAVVAAAVALGLILRLLDAASLYLNPDEAMHFCRSQPAHWFLNTTQEGTAPPLFFLLVHLTQKLSNTEWALRLPFLISGCLFPWVIYKWLQRLKLPVAALTALLILELSPNLVALTSQIRGYAIAMLFVSLALYFLERALESYSIPYLLISSTFLYLAILTEFSAAFACAALAIYAITRLASSGYNNFHLAWAGTQLGALAIYWSLYQFMMRDLLNSTKVTESLQGYLRGGFPKPGENLIGFAAVGTIKQFAYLAGSIPAGIFLFAMFCLGVFAIRTTYKEQNGWIFATCAAFGCAIVAAASGSFPFGRTRHSVLLALLATPIIAIGISKLLPASPRFSLPALGVLFAALMLTNEPDQQNIRRSAQQQGQMLEAIRTIRTTIPDNAYVLSDQETVWLLRYYLNAQACPTSLRGLDNLQQTRIDSRQFASYRWGFTSNGQAKADLERLRKQLPDANREPVYFLDGGFDQISWSVPGSKSIAGVFTLVAPF